MDVDGRPPAIALMGPTASGKSALALDWAQRHGGEIVSIDSALVYRGLDIGAAKPDADERARAPHHMIDLRDPWQPYSAAEFAIDARRAIDGILARGKLPILAGGTGLYLRALLHGLSPMPEADPSVRTQLEAEAAEQGWAALHAQLAAIDPAAAARIHATDAQRIQRALEVHRLSGRTISDWQREPASQRLPLRVLKLVLAPVERNVLHARIESRFDAMLAAGFLDEVRRLRALPELRDHPQPLALPALRAVGYRQAWEYLDALEGPSPPGSGDGVRVRREHEASVARRTLIRPGFDQSRGSFSRREKEAAFSEFRERAIFATRQLARRQLTWLRGELDARRFDPATERARLDEARALFL